MYGRSANEHICDQPSCRIDCETQGLTRGSGYPVLHIGDVAFFPTVDQLRNLHSTVGLWLRGHDDEQAGIPDSADASDALLAQAPDKDDGQRPPIREPEAVAAAIAAIGTEP